MSREARRWLVGLENPRETDADRAYLNELDSAPDDEDNEALGEDSEPLMNQPVEDEDERERQEGDLCPICSSILRDRLVRMGDRVTIQTYCPRCSSDSEGD